ncbi:hypothetical protein CSW08_16565 [Confluentibacter flavum]|uniref:Uncharacterized protein n=1 Tax=Confluentibacter flavum TaxID=1909700 RepID=A0A2N3HF59_9FLAO|nr:hypothetical protein CSW08_16565 [Confluentibacter flavum]
MYTTCLYAELLSGYTTNLAGYAQLLAFFVPLRFLVILCFLQFKPNITFSYNLSKQCLAFLPTLFATHKLDMFTKSTICT